MTVKIRLARHGAKKAPYYRVVVADVNSPRDGRFIAEVGRYNPNTDPSMIKLDLAAIDEWLAKGAQPTDTVTRLIGIARGEAEGNLRTARGNKHEQSKKAAAKAEALVADADSAEDGAE